MSETLEELGDYVAGALGEAVVGTEVAHGQLVVRAVTAKVVEVAKFLRDDDKLQCVSFTDLCGADYPSRAERFEVVTHLLSPKKNFRVRLKVTTDEATPVPSLTDLFPGATWFEREAYDLYGILFTGHPELRRLLTDYGFDGHPLRKDFPTTGYVEVRYDDAQKRVVYEPVKLAQEFRNFDFLSPWEGADYVLPGDEKASTR